MGDTFTESLPLDWIAPELPLMAASPHVWLWLTKRPDRLRQFSEKYELPANVWAGTSITRYQPQRLRHLVRTRAARRIISYEPILGPVDWQPWFDQGDNWWMIAGGESGSGAKHRQMSMKALESTIQQCLDAKVPVFVKQDSAMRPGQKGRIPDDLLIRQYPTIKIPRTPVILAR
jgi:protein gp37